MMVSRNLRFRFTLVSYNILSQTLMNSHDHLYVNCNPVDLEWPTRGQRIVSKLLKNQADIICLQEVETHHLNTLYEPQLARHGYGCLFKKKTGQILDGCAIFYKTKTFHLLNYKGIEFKRKDLAHYLNRDNVGIIAVLEPRFSLNKDVSKLVIANTHLLFNPRRKDIRLAQLKLFLSELEELSLISDKSDTGHTYYPTVLCGDLNSLPCSEIKDFIVKNVTPSNNTSVNRSDSQLSLLKTCVMTDTPNDDPQQYSSDEHTNEEVDRPDLVIGLNHNFKFKSVYPENNRRGQPYVSTFSSCIVDYIFYTPKLRLESYRELLTDDQLRNIGPIPNTEFPSDHIDLEASFSLK